MNKCLYLFSCIVIIVLCWSRDLLGIENYRLRKSESILDRLEQRLEDQERDPLNLEGEGQRNDDRKDVKTRYRYEKGITVTPKLRGDSKMTELGKAIDEMEAEVEQLSSSVQSVKHEIYQGSQIDNFIEIDTQITDTDRAYFRTIVTKLDGHTIYEMNESNDFWMPHNNIPLYAGPMQPGVHEIDFEARIVLKKPGKLPLSSKIYSIVKQTYKIDVSAGSEKKLWTILIDKPDGEKSELKVDLVQKPANK